MALNLSDFFSTINNNTHRLTLVNAMKGLLGLRNDAREGNIHIGGAASHPGIDSIKFNLDPAVVPSIEGVMHWDDANNTLSLGMIGGEVELQIGQEHLIRVFNNTGADIPNGACVYISDAGDQKPRVALADADNTNPIPEAVVVGLSTEVLLKNEQGFITTQGLVRDINTQGITEGVPLWLSPTVPGGFQEARPDAPDLNIAIGYCIRAHVSLGVILVEPTLVPRVIGLSDVYGTPSDGETIRWNATNERFEFGV